MVSFCLCPSYTRFLSLGVIMRKDNEKNVALNELKPLVYTV